MSYFFLVPTAPGTPLVYIDYVRDIMRISDFRYQPPIISVTVLPERPVSPHLRPILWEPVYDSDGELLNPL